MATTKSINVINVASEVEADGGIIAFIKEKEPVAVAFIVTWILGILGTVLVGHHIIGATEWSSLTNTIAPIAITVVLYGLGALTRSKVFSKSTVKTLEAKVAELDSVIKALVSVNTATQATPAPAGIPITLTSSKPPVI